MFIGCPPTPEGKEKTRMTVKMSEAARTAQRAYARQYYHDHKEQAAESNRRWRESHREELAAYSKQYRAEHRKEINAYYREYHRAHPEKTRAYNVAYWERRAAREAAAAAEAAK